MIKAVFLDMDGTVYSHDSGSVPPSALAALHALKRKGILLFCATGRHRLELRDLGCGRLPFDGWLTLNGAICYNADGIFHSVPADREDLAVLIEESGRYDFPVMFLEEDSMYINKADDLIRREMEEIHTPMPEIREVAGVPENDIFMAVPYCCDRIWNSFCGRLKHVKWTRWSRALDVMSSDVGKGEAVRHVLRRYRLKKEEVMAVGDGPNDLELFGACGVSVCMGNGSPQLKQAASYVTDHIENHGLRNAFAHFGMIQEE